MKNFLIVANNSHILKYADWFLKNFSFLGDVKFSFIILNPHQSLTLRPLSEQNVFFNQNQMITTQQMKSEELNLFLKLLEDEFFNSSFLNTSKLTKHNVLNNELSSSEDEIKPRDINHLDNQVQHQFQLIESHHVIDFKYNKNQKKVVLELKNAGTQFFDYVSIEQSHLATHYIESLLGIQIKEFYTLQESEHPDFVWYKYEFKFQHESFKFQHEFFLIDEVQYQDLLNNVFLVCPHFYKSESNSQINKKITLESTVLPSPSTHESIIQVWTRIPEHQKLNSQFHQDMQEIILEKLNKNFSFLKFESISNDQFNYNFHYRKNLKIKNKNYFNMFPPFHFFEQGQVEVVLNKLKTNFMKQNKIKPVTTAEHS